MSERRPYRYWEDPAWVADSDPKVVAKLIRNQRDLLDECERLIAGGERYTSELGHKKLVLNYFDAQGTLAKLRAAQEKADDRR